MTNPQADLANWSRENGCNMAMNWPIFEEYSEELKTIAKGSRASKLGKDNSDNNGVTMTSIKHKTDDSESNIDARSISNTANDSSNRLVKSIFFPVYFHISEGSIYVFTSIYAVLSRPIWKFE